VSHYKFKIEQSFIIEKNTKYSVCRLITDIRKLVTNLIKDSFIKEKICSEVSLRSSLTVNKKITRNRINKALIYDYYSGLNFIFISVVIIK